MTTDDERLRPRWKGRGWGRSIGAGVGRLRPASRAWRGAVWGVSLTGAVIWCAFSAAAIAPAGALAFILGLLGGWLAGALLGGVLMLLGWLWGRVPRLYRWALIAVLPLGLLAYMALPLAYGMLVVVAGLLLSGSLLGAGLFCLPGWRGARLAVFGGLGLGLLGLLFGGVFLLNDGAAVAAPPNAGALSAAGVTPLALENPGDVGRYRVLDLDYGSGTDRRSNYGGQAALVTPSVDGSALLEGWSGLRRAFWGFGPEALPLNAHVWYPEGDGPFNLILIVHGNHPMEDYSEMGYAYLGELLASRGFVVAAIDENFLNLSVPADLVFLSPLKEENDARAWLILEHLQQWKTWQNTPGNPFYQKVNLDGIGLIGHSRGGEAIALAAAFNRLQYDPDDASVTFRGNFNIRALAAIAPVDGQYLPADRPAPLENVNFLVLHGAQDMDVVSFSGSRQYARLAFTDGKPWFKAALYIYGANHGQFNRDWGRLDMLGPAAQLFNLRALMPAAEQEQIARVAVSAFMEAALHNRTEYCAFFRDPRAAPAWLPDTIYLNQYQDSDTLRVATFEEDIDLASGSLSGTQLRGEGLTIWREQVVSLKWGSLDNSAVALGWQGQPGDGPAARYVLRLPESGLALQPHSRFVFSLADANEPPVKGDKTGLKEPREPLDLTLEAVDRSGNTARLPLSHHALLQPQMPGRLGKLDWFAFLPQSEAVFQTFGFELADFARQNPGFDPLALVELRFVFDRSPSGVVLLDEIGFQP